ncbi:hypothetical protein J437_LFUL010134 [Ladona fulva]|uniref:Uncharacterized protein n=1 Tax=Ladona fulva TaxID=123851 RepID=A0A8K0KKE1_LADFU|nr:hypothetical protein J437_LFUL010134 [Ladona fulva]
MVGGICRSTPPTAPETPFCSCSSLATRTIVWALLASFTRRDFLTLIKNIQPRTSKTTMRKNVIIPKLVAVLHMCLLISPLFNEFETERACGSIKANSQNEVPDVVTVHWDGKLLPALDVPKSKEGHFPIVILYVIKEELIAVPRLESSSGSRQVQAVWNVIVDWNLEDKVQFFVVYYGFKYKLYQWCLIFEVKISQVTTNHDIPLFKKFQHNWKSIDPDKIQCYKENLALHLTVSEIDSLLELY